jgi:lyso-ornithine lipid O-acyltransferase
MKLRAPVVLVAFFFVTLPGMALQHLLIAVDSKWKRTLPFRYHRLVCRLLGIRLHVRGTPVSGQPCLIAANHVSWLDIPILSAAAPLSFIAKREVNSWPFFGSLARLQRTVFVDREHRHTTGGARDEMAERLASGDTLVLFAEGTSSDGNRVLPFKTAFFGAATDPSTLVQPVTVAYRGCWGLPMNRRQRPYYAWYGDMALESHLWHAVSYGPIEVTLVFHEPLTMARAGGRKQLARLSESMVRSGLVAALTGSNPRALAQTAA